VGAHGGEEVVAATERRVKSVGMEVLYVNSADPLRMPTDEGHRIDANPRQVPAVTEKRMTLVDTRSGTIEPLTPCLGTVSRSVWSHV
jgi:hypothetical protein